MNKTQEAVGGYPPTENEIATTITANSQTGSTEKLKHWPFPISPDEDEFGSLDFSKWSFHEGQEDLGGDSADYEVICRNLERLGAVLITVGQELALAQHPATATPDLLAEAILRLEYQATSLPKRLKEIADIALKSAPTDIFQAKDYLDFVVRAVSRD